MTACRAGAVYLQSPAVMLRKSGHTHHGITFRHEVLGLNTVFNFSMSGLKFTTP